MWQWNGSAGAFSLVHTTTQTRSQVNLGNQFGKTKAWAWRRGSDSVWFVFVGAINSAHNAINSRYYSGSSTVATAQVIGAFTGLGADIVSTGDGFTVPTARGTSHPVTAYLDGAASRLHLLTGTGVQRRSQLLTSSRRAPAHGVRKGDVMCDGPRLWVAYPRDNVGSDRLFVTNGPSPTGLADVTFRTDVPQPPPFPHSSMTADKILRVWLCEATGVGGSQRLLVAVEFERETANSFYQNYAGGAIRTPVFWMTGDYSGNADISWNEDNWQPLIAPADQALFAQYANTDLDDPAASPVIGFTKHSLEGAFWAGVIQYATRAVDAIKIGDFGVAPDRPVWRTPRQISGGTITPVSAPDTANDYGGHYVADASHPLTLSWTYSSPEGGQQYAYRLRRFLPGTGVTEYWTGTTWTPRLDDGSLVVVGSIGGVAEITLPGSSTSGWGRDSSGALIAETYDLRVQTFAEEGGPASAFSGRLQVTPSEAQQPAMITPQGAYGTLALAGALDAGTIQSGNAFPLPTSLDLSTRIGGVGPLVGQAAVQTFDQGHLIRLLTDVTNFRVRVRGTATPATGPIQLVNVPPGQALPSQATGGTVVASSSISNGNWAIDFQTALGRAGSHWWLRAQVQSDITIASIELLGTTGRDTTLFSPRFTVRWTFPAVIADPQTRYIVKLFRGRVTSGFDQESPLDQADVADPVSREIDIDIFEEGVYTVSLQTQGSSLVAGVPGLLSVPTYAIFTADLVEPTIPETEAVIVATSERNGAGDVVPAAGPADGRGDTLGLLYRVAYPAVTVPETPGVGSAYGANSIVDASWRKPWENGSPIDVWQFQLDNGRQIEIQAASLLDENCPIASWSGVSNGNHTVRARAHNAAGWSAWSQTRSVLVSTVGADAPATVPTAPPAPALEVRHTGIVVVLMCDPAGYTGRRTAPVTGRRGRYRRVGTSAWTEFGFDDGLNDREEGIGPLLNNQIYEFQVRASNDVGNGAWSASYQVTPPNTGRFRGQIPERAVIRRREVGTDGDGIPIAEVDADVDPSNTLRNLLQYLDWSAGTGQRWEYSAQTFLTVAGGALVEHDLDWIAAPTEVTGPNTRLMTIADARGNTLLPSGIRAVAAQNFARKRLRSARNESTAAGITHVLVGAPEPTETPVLNVVNVPIAVHRALEALIGQSVMVLDGRFGAVGGVVRAVEASGTNAHRGRIDRVNVRMMIESEFPAIIPDAALRRRVHNVIAPGE